MIASNPLSIGGHQHLVSVYANASRGGAAVSKILENQSRDWDLLPISVFRIGDFQRSANRADEAAATLRNWAAATDRNVADVEQLGAHFIQFRQTGITVRVSEDLVERLKLGDRDLVAVYALLGDKEKTMGILLRLYRERAGMPFFLDLNVYVLFDFVRNEPRFIELLERIGFTG